MEQQRWWSKTILIGAVGAALLLPIGALGAKFGWWHFSVGFRFLMGGAVLGALGLFTGVVAIFVAHKKGLVADRKPAYLGTIISVLIVGVLLVQFNLARSVPPIHNISTDPNDPPSFDAVVALRGDSANPLDYDAAKLAEQQLAAYPDVKPLRTDLDPAASFARTVAVIEEMGLDLVNADPDAGIVEATDETFWFGFKDDLVVRLRGERDGTLVDVRSVSRVGQSDLGANARRIANFLQRF